MTLPSDLNLYISAAMFFLGAYIFALYLGMIVWTVRDIRSRSRDMLAQIMATLLVAVFNVPGLLIYILLRPHTTLAEEYERSLAEEAILQELEDRRVCPGCRQRIEPDFVVCPNCHQQLRLRCVDCGRLLNPNWDVCPYCGRFRDERGLADAMEPAAAVERAGLQPMTSYGRSATNLDADYAFSTTDPLDKAMADEGGPTREGDGTQRESGQAIELPGLQDEAVAVADWERRRDVEARQRRSRGEG